MAQSTYIARKGQDADFANVTISGTLSVTGETDLTVDLDLADDQDLRFGTDNDTLIRFSTADASNPATVLALDNTSQQLHVTDVGAVATDWARSAGTHPEIAIHSNTTPATDYLAIGNHDGTTATIDVVGGTTLNLDVAGSNVVAVTAGSLAVAAVSGVTTVGPIVKLTETVGYAAFTDGGAAVGTYDLTVGTIPAGALYLGTAVTAVTGFAGDTSAALTLGDGTDVDRYNTSTVDVFSTAANGVAAGSPSGVLYHDAAKTPKITITTASDWTSVSAGSVTVEMYYLT